MKKKLFILIILLILKMDVSALTYAGCDYSLVSKMKSFVTNINISYDYHIVNDRAYFDVTINNIVPNMYFVDTYTDKTYTYNDTNNGEITIKDYTNSSGSYKFYSAISECNGIALGTKYYKFPTYNTYYASESCKDIPNFSLCQKWVSVNYSSTEFERLVSEYKDSLNPDDDSKEELIEHESTFFDKVINIYINNYYYFLGGIIIICGIIMIINRRSNRFKL